MIDSLVKEISLQKDYLSDKTIETIYFGGGTPSVLSKQELKCILQSVYSNFEISSQAEITCEANPDDLSDVKIKELVDVGINRLSIGIQSFNNDILKSFNRAHDSNMALNSVQRAQSIGISNISIDLIFGAPEQSTKILCSDLEIIHQLNVPHVSIYGLTIEDKTAFGRWYARGQLIPQEEEIVAEQFEIIIRDLSDWGYNQYEISNFAKNGFESQHNSSYWKSKSYIGIGPSAHSYNGESRQYNISNNYKYIKSIEREEIPFEKEILTKKDHINERILIQLRTIHGLDKKALIHDFDYDIVSLKSNEINQFIKLKLITQTESHLVLSRKGRLLSDSIIEKLIM